MPVSLDAVINDVCEFMQGSCKSLGEAIDTFDLDVEEHVLEDALLSNDVEICVHCHWWHEVCELVYNQDSGGGLCDDCREELGIEDD